jgi:hypothetical protein
VSSKNSKSLAQFIIEDSSRVAECEMKIQEISRELEQLKGREGTVIQIDMKLLRGLLRLNSHFSTAISWFRRGTVSKTFQTESTGSPISKQSAQRTE